MYTMAGDYEVNAVVYREIEGSIQPFDSLQVTIHVTPLIEITVVDNTCDSIYYFHGNPYMVPYFGDELVPSDEGCDTIYHLDFSHPPTSSVTLDTTICQGQGVMWLDTLRTETNSYFAIVPGPDGCEILHTLSQAIHKLWSNVGILKHLVEFGRQRVFLLHRIAILVEF